jgi:hypothetical protein
MSQNHWIIAPDAHPKSTTESKYFKVNLIASKRLNYGFDLALNDYRELPFFNQSITNYNPVNAGLKYDVLFENRAIAIELNGQLKYQLSDKLFWKNQLKYIQFSLIRENDQAWGIIPLEITTDLNWKPVLNAQSAVELTINWYKNNYKNKSARELMESDIKYYQSKINE